MRIALIFGLLVTSFHAFAEGACPPGQYPVGGQGVQGCAPIPGGGGAGAAPSAPRATGKWETRWGAIAEDSSANVRGVPLATGVSESKRSKREAEKVAVEQCRAGGGLKCEVTATYNNQCIAVADPMPRSQGGPGGRSSTYSAGTAEQAKDLAMKGCSVAENSGCSITYSACSMSEFKAF
ncbi:DUF4189 domain-containing protein [Stenotrophomonas sp. PD6]|uniref:DUF4189 domain-containing protein n=1 Tax=Stenotrophomonas sp. PD6 TaxID=3368612 RepID=UPI003BA18C97